MWWNWTTYLGGDIMTDGYSQADVKVMRDACRNNLAHLRIKDHRDSLFDHTWNRGWNDRLEGNKRDSGWKDFHYYDEVYCTGYACAGGDFTWCSMKVSVSPSPQEDYFDGDDTMARSDGEAAFDNFVTQNQQAFQRNRGATSPFKQIEAPPGLYYAQIIDATRDVESMETKDAQGNKTGYKVPYGRIRYRIALIADADPKCMPAQREMYAGAQGFITYMIPPENNDDAIQRIYSDLAEMGINTNLLVLRQQDIQDASSQFTLGQVIDLIQSEKPYCTVAISQKDASAPKYINYRKAVREEDLVQLLGHPVGSNVQVSEPEPVHHQQLVAVAAPDPGQPVWDQANNRWFDPATNAYYDVNGQFIAEAAPAVPAAPPFTPTFTPVVPVRPSPMGVPTQQTLSRPSPLGLGGPPKPGSR